MHLSEVTLCNRDLGIWAQKKPIALAIDKDGRSKVKIDIREFIKKSFHRSASSRVSGVKVGLELSHPEINFCTPGA